MKKSLSWLIVMIMLLSLTCSALAIVVKPGDSFDVTFAVEANPDNAVAATVKTQYDTNTFTQNNNSSFESGNGQLFDLNGIKSGSELTGNFTVKDSAAAGDYELTVTVKQAGDINENNVTSLKFSGTTVTVENNQPVKEPTPADPTPEEPAPTEPTPEEPKPEEPKPEEPKTDSSADAEIDITALYSKEFLPSAPKAHWMHNNIRSDGPMLNDLKPGVTEKWYTATPVDLSQSGQIEIPLWTGGYYIIGTAVIDIQGDAVTVTYRYNKDCDDTAEYRFYTFFHDANSIEGAEYNQIENRFEYGATYSIANDLSGDTEVIFYMLNKAMHTW